jgi:hypothetical protein
MDLKLNKSADFQNCRKPEKETKKEDDEARRKKKEEKT